MQTRQLAISVCAVVLLYAAPSHADHDYVPFACEVDGSCIEEEVFVRKVNPNLILVCTGDCESDDANAVIELTTLRLERKRTDMNRFTRSALHKRWVHLTYDPESLTVVRIIGSFSDDGRGIFNTVGNFGLAIESFAVDQTSRYINPQDSGDAQERFIGGFNFEYRMHGHPGRGQQLWLLGEVAHGVRSTDIDCRADPSIPVCQGVDLTTPGAATLFILRNAKSLEGHLSIRWEFKPLNRGSGTPMRLYLQGQSGFIAISGDGKDALDLNSLSFGMLATRGRFQRSHIEFGYGTNDLFVESESRRYRLDALVMWSPRWLERAGIKPYYRITGHTDLAEDPDSILSYVGVNFDLDRLFGPDIKIRKLGM